MIIRYIIFYFVLLFSFPSALKADNNLYWFLGASLSKPGKEIVRNFNAEKQDFKVVLITGGSGELLSKILISGKGGIYTPASEYYLKKAQKKGIAGKYRRLIKQVPVFGLSGKLKDKYITFTDLASDRYKIALGNPGTMALGQSFDKMKKRMPQNIVDGFEKNTAVYAVTVTQIVSYVINNIVDAGLMFETVADVNNIKYITIPEKYNIPEYAFFITIKNRTDLEKAEIFEDYVFSHKDVFKKYGYRIE